MTYKPRSTLKLPGGGTSPLSSSRIGSFWLVHPFDSVVSSLADYVDGRLVVLVRRPVEPLPVFEQEDAPFVEGNRASAIRARHLNPRVKSVKGPTERVNHGNMKRTIPATMTTETRLSVRNADCECGRAQSVSQNTQGRRGQTGVSKHSGRESSIFGLRE